MSIQLFKETGPTSDFCESDEEGVVWLFMVVAATSFDVFNPSRRGRLFDKPECRTLVTAGEGVAGVETGEGVTRSCSPPTVRKRLFFRC